MSLVQRWGGVNGGIVIAAFETNWDHWLPAGEWVFAFKVSQAMPPHTKDAKAAKVWRN